MLRSIRRHRFATCRSTQLLRASRATALSAPPPTGMVKASSTARARLENCPFGHDIRFDAYYDIQMSVDLQVMQVFVQGYDHDHVVREGQPFYVSAEYHNASEHSSGPFQVTFVMDGHSQHAIDVSDAAASESQWVQWQTNGIVAGVHQVRVGFSGVQHESEHL